MKKDEEKKRQIPEGKIIDFIDGKAKKDSEAEQVRQNFERTLVEEYRYAPEDIAVDFKIKTMDGSRKVTKKISLAVFHKEKGAPPRTR